MAQSQQVLSKAQEQLNYATSRCGTLMEQLGRIKSHVNWKQKVKESLVEENSDEEKEDGTISKGKIKAHHSESTETNLSELVQIIDENKKNTKKKIKDESSDEERKLNILSPGSSCFVSLASGNSSIATRSLFSSEEEVEDENIKEDEIEVNEEEENDKYSLFETEAFKEKEWETDEAQDSEEVEDEENEYETEEEEVMEPFYENRKSNKGQIYTHIMEENHGKNDKEIESKNKSSTYLKKELDILSINTESMSERSVESDNSSDYSTTDLEDGNEQDEEIHKVETELKVERKEEFDDKIELMEKKSKEEAVPKITSPLKVNLFTEELATEFIPVTQDLDKDIEIIEINANDFNQNSIDKNDSKEKQSESIKDNIESLIQKDTNGNENKFAVKVEHSNVQNKSTTKSNNKTDKFEKRPPSSEPGDAVRQKAVKDFNKNTNLSQVANSITARHKFTNVGSNKKVKEPALPVIMENEVTENEKKDETLKNSSQMIKRNHPESLVEVKTDNKKEIGKKNIDKEDKLKLIKQENVKISGKKSAVNVSNLKDQIKPLNVFERLSLNIKKSENIRNKPTISNIKSNQLIKKSNDNIKNKKYDEKLSKVKNINNKIPKPQDNVLSEKSSEEVISRSLFESIQKTIRKNLNLKDENIQTSENPTKEKMGEDNRSASEDAVSVNKINSSTTAKLDLQKNKYNNVNYQENSKDLKRITTAGAARLKVNKPVLGNKVSNKSNIFNEKKSEEKVDVVSDKEFTRSELAIDNKEETLQDDSVSFENEIIQDWFNINNKLFKTESERNITLLRNGNPNSRRPESENRRGSNFKLKSWDENSDFGKTIVKQTKNVMPHYGPGANMNYNAYNNYNNMKIANSLGFNTIPFIVGQSTSRSYHIGLNIQQTLSLMNLSPSVPTLKIGVENKNVLDSEKDSTLGSQTTATYKPKSCPACTAKPQDIKDEDDDIIISEDPWHVPQKDTWDQQNIAFRKSSRCTCLPTNIISFNEVLSQMFQAEGLMPSRPLSSTNLTFDSRQDFGKSDQENKKLIVRANNATYLTRLLRNIQRIQDQYIVPITKLSLNGFKNNTP